MKKQILLVLSISTLLLAIFGGCTMRKQVPQGPCIAKKDAVEKICSVAIFEERLKSGKPVILKCSSRGCPPCMLMAPLFEQIARKYAGQAHFIEVDVVYPELRPIVAQYVLTGVPTFVFFNRHGKLLTANAGSISEELLELLVQQALKAR